MRVSRGALKLGEGVLVLAVVCAMERAADMQCTQSCYQWRHLLKAPEADLANEACQALHAPAAAAQTVALSLQHGGISTP